MVTALAPHIMTYLGGPAVMGHEVRSDHDLVEAVQAGLPVEAIDSVLERDLLTPQEIDRLIIPRRTLSYRRVRRERLTLDESDKLARVTRVLSVAAQAFDDEAKAARWLRRPSRVLRGAVPLDLLVTSDGARLVEDELTRIASGDLA